MSLGLVIYAQDLPALSDFYQQSLGFTRIDGDDSYAQLTLGTAELVILQTKGTFTNASTEPRANVAIKPVLFVDQDLAKLRDAITSKGGFLKPAAAEWQFGDKTVCDGHDPEGNIFQLRA